MYAVCIYSLPAMHAHPDAPTLQAHYRDHGKLQFARSLLVLHNMAHQGRAPLEELSWLEVPERYEELFRCGVAVLAGGGEETGGQGRHLLLRPLAGPRGDASWLHACIPLRAAHEACHPAMPLRLASLASSCPAGCTTRTTAST